MILGVRGACLVPDHCLFKWCQAASEESGGRGEEASCTACAEVLLSCPDLLSGHLCEAHTIQGNGR